MDDRKKYYHIVPLFGKYFLLYLFTNTAYKKSVETALNKEAHEDKFIPY